MTKTCRAVPAFFVLALLLTRVPAPAGELRLEDLVSEMVDMERLAVAPEPGLDCDQQSSYDRASTSPDAPGWFANGDAGQFIREETNAGRREWVMAEMKGPGVIERIWSANPDGGGTVRIYIDDLTKPAIQEDFLALTSAQVPAFAAPYSGRRALGANLYFPLGYQERCKVTVSQPGLYYQVGYRTYPEGTRIESFSYDALSRAKAVVDEVGAMLSVPGSRFIVTPGAVRRGLTIELGPREAKSIRLAGPAAITRMEIRADVPKEQLLSALREPVLMMKWDGAGRPAVWCPLGDFFGSTPGINPYHSLPAGMTADGVLYSNWFMPFGRSAEIVVRNDSKDPVRYRLALWTRPIDWGSRQWIYFHSKWHVEWLPGEPAFLDWPLLECVGGSGRFVGVMLGVNNTAPGWWGEGDEKVFVDADTFPSYIGTGSEDYFGYAWCNPALFEHAYHAQSICTGPGNFGYTAVARFHVADDIPFHDRYDMTIEKWDAADREYCATAYWYAPAGNEDMFRFIPEGFRKVRPLAGATRVEGAIEGEDIEVITISGGAKEVQGLSGGFSNWAHLWWLDPKEGDTLELAVPVEKAGAYDLTVGLTKSWDYGIHQLYFDGKKLGGPVDLCASEITPLKLSLGRLDLTAGRHVLKVECVGTNPGAKPVRRMFGLDYVLLKPAK